MPSQSRRSFLETSVCLAAAAVASPAFARNATKPAFRISLAQWSLHKSLGAKTLDHLDFAVKAKNDFGIEAVEYVNSFFKDKAKDASYLAEMNSRAADNGVTQLLIMIDNEGQLGHPDDAQRATAVKNHHRWVEAARELGCHSIRVNAASQGSYEDQISLAADGLRAVTEYGDMHDINVIVENHGGLSSNGEWLASVMKKVDHPRCGTLPDFGNFRLSGDEWYDRYKGVAELMPFAKAVSAKSHDFDADGNDTQTDYRRMMKIVLDAGYNGWVGIEYEGSKLSEDDGIKATKVLLERVRDALA
ncbi:MAG: sugar phosphate isomerase/epimerase family protein [Planctomycetaceae bacterium]|jgi:sugar phosphate isomerase/epimerase